MSKFLTGIGLCLILLLCNACEKVIDFDVPESDPLIVVNGFITEGDSLRLDISSSLSYLESSTEIPVISGAQITLVNSSESITFEESQETPGTYFSTTEILNFGEYQLSVDADGFDGVEASTAIPTQVIGTAEFLGSEEVEYEFRLTFQDVPNSEDYYHLILLESDEVFGYTQVLPFTSNDEILISSSGNSSLGDENYFYFNGYFKDILFENDQAVIDFSFEAYNEEADYYLQLVRCSREYFEYHQSFNAYQDSDGLFTQPVQVYSNIEGGIGVFGGYSYTEIPLNF